MEDAPAPAVGTEDPASLGARRTGRSRTIRRLRLLLPAAMGFAVLAIAGWIGVRAVVGGLRSDKAATGGLHMTHPHFFGRDEGGRAFSLEAVEAVRDARDLDKITLVQPRISLDYGAEHPTTARAPNGLYSQPQRQVLLTGGVILEDGKGARLDSPSAMVNTRTGDIDGRGNVSGVSPLGRFQASSYLVRGKGAQIVFSGGVRAHLFNSPGPAAR